MMSYADKTVEMCKKKNSHGILELQRSRCEYHVMPRPSEFSLLGVCVCAYAGDNEKFRLTVAHISRLT
jgi:hypothetical protein